MYSRNGKTSSIIELVDMSMNTVYNQIYNAFDCTIVDMLADA